MEETYYGRKFKFIVRDGVEFLISNNGCEWRTDKRPPGDCDRCGDEPLGVAIWQGQVEVTGPGGGTA